jgi:hypothetical protein
MVRARLKSVTRLLCNFCAALIAEKLNRIAFSARVIGSAGLAAAKIRGVSARTAREDFQARGGGPTAQEEGAGSSSHRPGTEDAAVQRLQGA